MNLNVSPAVSKLLTALALGLPAAAAAFGEPYLTIAGLVSTAVLSALHVNVTKK